MELHARAREIAVAPRVFDIVPYMEASWSPHEVWWARCLERGLIGDLAFEDGLCYMGYWLYEQYEAEMGSLVDAEFAKRTHCPLPRGMSAPYGREHGFVELTELVSKGVVCVDHNWYYGKPDVRVRPHAAQSFRVPARSVAVEEFRKCGRPNFMRCRDMPRINPEWDTLLQWLATLLANEFRWVGPAVKARHMYEVYRREAPAGPLLTFELACASLCRHTGCKHEGEYLVFPPYEQIYVEFRHATGEADFGFGIYAYKDL